MSTRASVAWDESFHFYEELMDDRLWLEVEVDQFKVNQWRAGAPVRICFPLPPKLIKKVLRAEYRRFAPTPAERKRRQKRARANIERFLRELEKRRKLDPKAGLSLKAGERAPGRAHPAQRVKSRSRRGRSRGAPLPKRE